MDCTRLGIDGRSSRSLASCLLLVVAASACMSDVAEPGSNEDIGVTGDGFEEWRDSLPVVEPSGYRGVEDDMVMGDSMLRDYYDEHFGVANGLLLHYNGNPASKTVWPSGTRANLTYCISNNFNTLGATAKQNVINYMAWAGQQWQTATNNTVVFRYVPAQDATCTNANNNVLFNVEVNAPPGCTAASGTCCPSLGGNCAFFPDPTDFPRSKRILYLGKGLPTTDPAASAQGYLAHELGHILGFGHEQSRLAGTPYACGAEEVLYAPLTRYDNNSIMHYNPCVGWAGVNIAGPNADLLLSIWDIRGAQCAYQGLCEWVQIAGANTARDIDIDQSANVWSFSNVAKDASGFFLQKWNHSTLRWDVSATPTGGTRVTVASNGLPWYVTAKKEIYRASNGQIVKVVGAANDISAGLDGSVWAVTNSPVNGGYKIAKWNGTTWVEQLGIFGVRIAVDRIGLPFVLLPDGRIYHLDAGTWKQWPGNAMDIDTGSDGSIWAVNSIGAIFQWNYAAAIWEQATGVARAISVAQNGQPWIILGDYSTNIDRWVP